uniref:Protein YIPF n=1 Tax=Dracunculus medinensis TaxID=318479 RepID=A0A0N4UK01_DRAME
LQLEKQIVSKEQSHLSGDIAGTKANKIPSLETDFDTLNEPVWDTVKRDMNAVGAKFKHVFMPENNDRLIREWDLWGPLFICVFLSLLGNGPHFTEMFTLTFFGSCIVTLNTKLLGGKISFFQSLCVLGYCLLPTGTAAIVCKLIVFSSEQTTTLFALRLLVTVAGFSWATYASMTFFATSQPPRRKALSVYPVFLFYFVISWIIISRSK